MANIADVIINLRAQAGDVETGFKRAEAALTQFTNKLKQPQVLKISVVMTMGTAGSAVAAAKMGSSIYDNIDATKEASGVVEEYSRNISEKMAGAYERISDVASKQMTNMSNITMALFKDSSNAAAGFADYMDGILERNAKSWYGFAENVGEAIGWITKGILSVGATVGWLTESATIIIEDWADQISGIWDNLWQYLKGPFTAFYDWFVNKFGWIVDVVKEAWSFITGSQASDFGLTEKATKKLNEASEKYKQGLSGIWNAKDRKPTPKELKHEPATGKMEKPDKWIDDYDQKILAMYQLEVKYRDGILSGLNQIKSQKMDLIEFDQKNLDLQRQMGMSETEYNSKTLELLDKKKQASQEVLDTLLKYTNVIPASLVYEIEKNDKIIEQQKERIKQAEYLRTDALAGMTEGMKQLQDEYTSYGTLMKDYTISTFRTMEDSLTNFVKNGKINFKNLVDSMIADLARLAAKIMIGTTLKGLFGEGGFGSGGGLLGPIMNTMQSKFDILSMGGNTAAMNAFSMLPQALGGAWMGGIQRFAYGGVFHSPRVFPMANGGVGMLGEAGPEAVMPLTRTADGKLGVQSSGGGSGGGAMVVNLTIQAVDALSLSELMNKNPQAILGPLEKALQGNGSIRNTIRSNMR